MGLTNKLTAPARAVLRRRTGEVSVVTYAMRRGMSRGVGDGSRTWLAVGGLALGFRVLQWMARPGKPTVVCEDLAPGQTLVITHLSPE